MTTKTATTSPVRGGGRHARLLRLLDAERRVLLDGPLAGLTALVEKREALLDELLARGGEPPEGFLDALKERAERNGRLLLASLAGLKAGRSQVESAESARGRLTTYTASGAAIDVQAPPTTHDQRR